MEVEMSAIIWDAKSPPPASFYSEERETYG